MNIEVSINYEEREPNGLAQVSVHVPELGVKPVVDMNFKALFERCGVPDGATLDLLLVASVCYVIDKTIPRSSTFDNWTRELTVSIPVSSPRLWQGVVSDLQSALKFLSGDVWSLSFRVANGELFQPPVKRQPRRQVAAPFPVNEANAVCLFSGGLDSLIGAINLLAEKDDRRVMLVGHYDTPGPHKQQNDLFTSIRDEYSRRTELLQMRVAHKPRRAAENTLRSRSLIFMALGISVARAAGADIPLYAPENGLIAINIPLTPSRSGSCSTRTMHPYFLGKLAATFRGLGIDNEIVNPFQLKTKGECLAECDNPKLLRKLADLSVSCSHGTRRQHWIRRQGIDNCGYCVPCLIRRAALHHINADNGKRYGFDICRAELTVDDVRTSADDLRAIFDLLRQNKTAKDYTDEIQRIASIPQVSETAKMLARGFGEIRTLLRDKGLASVRQAARVI